MPGSDVSLVLFPLKTILEEATCLEVHVRSFSFPIIQSCVGIQTSIISLIGLRIFVQGKENKFIHQMHRKVNPNFGSYPMDN